MAPRGASAELEGLTGVWAAVKCLVAVGASNVDLIKAHARLAAHALTLIQHARKPSRWCQQLIMHYRYTTCPARCELCAVSRMCCGGTPRRVRLWKILRYSRAGWCGRWIVRADPEAGLEMFAEMRPPLAPETALSILASEAPNLAAPYLQAALASGAARPEVFDTELALIYLRSALEQRRPVAERAGSSLPGVALPLLLFCLIFFSH